MKKTVKCPLSVLLTLAMLLSLLLSFGVTAGAAEDGDYDYWDAYASSAEAETDYSVSEGDGYIIKSAAGLAYFASLVNGGDDFADRTVTLADDIDLGAYLWVPVAQNALSAEFKGIFDGAGHTVDNLIIGGDAYSKDSGAYSEANALFSTNAGTIKDVHVTNVNVTTYRRGGGIAGINSGVVENCSSSGGISANGGGGDRGTGGIVGTNYGVVKDCYSIANIYNAYRRAGGIVGYNSGDAAVVEDCWFAGYASSASNGYSGSIAATNDPGAVVRNCYGFVGGSSDGRLVGLNSEGGIVEGTYEFNADGSLIGGSGSITDIFPAAGFFLPEEGEGYSVAAAASLEGGTLSFSPRGAIAPGETVTVTPTPALGNAVESVTVFDMYGKAILVAEEDGVYSFVMPNCDVTVTADFGADTTSPVVLVIKSDDGVFSDVDVTEAALRAYGTTKTGYTMGSAEYSSVTGITLADLLKYYAPGGEYATSVYFYDDYPGSHSSEFFPQDPEHDSAMLLWSGISDGSEKIFGLRSALNGGGGRFWWSGINTVGVSLPDSAAAFSVTPANAAVVVKNTADADKIITPGEDGKYALKQGIVYTYTVSAGGYVAKDGSLTPAAAEETVAVALSPVSGGGSGDGGGGVNYYTVTGYNGAEGTVAPSAATAKAGDRITLTVTPAEGYGIVALSAGGAAISGEVTPGTNTYTFNMPSQNVTIAATFEKLALTVYSQRGENGAPVKAAVFTKADLKALATTNSSGYAYLYAQNDAWRAVVATELVTLDALLDTSGVSGNWRSGSYLKFDCYDGPYDKSYPYYENIRECRYYIEGGVTTEVPAGLAIQWNSGELTSGGVSGIAAGAYDSGRLRFVYGVSPAQYNEMIAAGARSPSGVESITVVYEASSIPGGSVGIDHGSGNTNAGGGAGAETAPVESPTVESSVGVSPSTGLPFTDVKAGDWFYGAVEYAQTRGLMGGVGDNQFAPNTNLTRAMLVTILQRYAGAGSPTESGNTFTDVPAGRWYAGSVAWASANGIVNGYGDGLFGPDDDVTREQFAAILQNFARWLSLDVSKSADISGYEDAGKVSGWALSSVQWAFAEGLIAGRTETTLAPEGTATRAEAAAMLMRFIENFVKKA